MASSNDAANKPQYTVQAVVPNRAWLQTADGKSMTVTIGGTVPGLGKVTAINPYSGNVSTDTGVTLSYAGSAS